MALTVEDIFELPALNKLKLVSGEQGLSRYVVSSGIVDHEYAPGTNNKIVFDRESFVVSSLLFAINDSSLILHAFKDLYSKGISAIAYKDVIYDTLPVEVIEYSNEVGLPIFKFGTDLYSENLIFEIMSAIKDEDSTFLSEDNIRLMIDGKLYPGQIENITRNISLKFRENVCCFHIYREDSDLINIYKRYLSNIGLSDRLLVCRYRDGLFILTTSDLSDNKSHRIILRQFLDILGLNENDFIVSSSDVINVADFDIAFRQSYYCFIATMASGEFFSSFDKIGSFQALIPSARLQETRTYVDEQLKVLGTNREIVNTICYFIKNKGDIMATSFDMDCHHSTVRYRLLKIKERIGHSEYSDTELYKELYMPVILDKLIQMLK